MNSFKRIWRQFTRPSLSAELAAIEPNHILVWFDDHLDRRYAVLNLEDFDTILEMAQISREKIEPASP